jgi:hypothetical protein
VEVELEGEPLLTLLVGLATGAGACCGVATCISENQKWMGKQAAGMANESKSYEK